MNRFILIVILLSILILSPLSFISAQEVRNGELVVLGKDEVIDEVYFAAGETVTIAGTINNDAYAAGGMVNIEGVVNGDLLAAGGVVNLRGTVNKDVRVAGGQVNISGTVGGNVTVAGGSVTIADSAVITGSIVAGGGSVSIQAPVEGGITAGAGQLTIANTVGGNVMAGAGELALTPNAQINGNLTYMSEDPAQIQSGATVSGIIQRNQPPVTENKARKAADTAKEGLKAFSILWKIISLISTFIVGAVLIALAPNFMRQTAESIEKKPWTTMLIGLLVLMLAPVAILVLLASIVGIPLSIIFMFAYLLYIYLSKIPVALFIGQRVLGYTNPKSKSLILAFLFGLIVYGIVTLIPVIGGIVAFFTLITGMGALLITKKNYLTMLRGQKTI